MRKLGEQWVEEFDEKMHMLKAMGNTAGGCRGCDLQVVENCYGTCGASDGCDFIVKDLGILNEDGCLPNCWGEYPRIEERVDVHTNEHWFRCITRNNVYCATDSYKTKQEAIEAWNRRA